VVGLIEDALAHSDLNALLSAIADAQRMSPPLKHQRLDDAIRMKDVLEEEKDLRLKLRKAIEDKDVPRIVELLARAQVRKHTAIALHCIARNADVALCSSAARSG
jgi:hypothetical protein